MAVVKAPALFQRSNKKPLLEIVLFLVGTVLECISKAQ